MKNLILALMAIAATTSINAQWFGSKTVRGNGNVTTIERNTGDYDQVSVAGFFDVELVSGTEGEITIQAEENLIPHIITEVDGNNLKIKTEKGYNLNPSYNKQVLIIVPFEDISEVNLAGSGDVVTKNTIKSSSFKASLSGSGDVLLNIEAENIKGNVSGSGDLSFSGTTTHFKCSLAGSGDIDAKNLKAENVEASLSGSGDIEVYCSGNLKARVVGSGDIDYYGNPTKEDSKIAGSGDISRG
ncbi:DUF2807 domain-containing protein [Galbibacter sp. EGI 63066]|uniref:head GIN domain-containing protein n=1 Tax=Galbibacter sp. EGI 63066 TaxID=2993559 RepID=UPI00224946AB|nr:head GIN domain-containing protein [Galbibacter sp. EGI 63066]MCX2679183.1 DUF2807 domain-containing protein [Galbibacter sp. EGI 63066]